MNVRACQVRRLEHACSPIITSRWLRCMLSPGYCILQWQTFASLWLACLNFGLNLPRSRSPHSSYHYGQACANVARSGPLFSLPMPFYLCLTHVRCCQDGEKSKSLREAQVLEVNVMPSNGVPLAAFHHARDWPGIPCWEGNNIAWVGNTYYILYYKSRGDSMWEHGL